VSNTSSVVNAQFLRKLAMNPANDTVDPPIKQAVCAVIISGTH